MTRKGAGQCNIVVISDQFLQVFIDYDRVKSSVNKINWSGNVSDLLQRVLVNDGDIERVQKNRQVGFINTVARIN